MLYRRGVGVAPAQLCQSKKICDHEDFTPIQLNNTASVVMNAE